MDKAQSTSKPKAKRAAKATAAKTSAAKATAAKTSAAKATAAKTSAAAKPAIAKDAPTRPVPLPKRVPHRAPGRSDDAHAFIPDPSEGGKPPTEDLAELLGEDFIQAATSGNDALDDDLDATLPDEVGGPFVITRARDELAGGTDASNPVDAEPAAFPTTSAGLVGRRVEEEEEEDES